MAFVSVRTLGFCALVVMVSASVSEQLLKVPLFEVGSLWVKATQDVGARIKSSLFQVPDLSNPMTYVVIALLAYVAYHAFVLFFVPMDRVRLLGDLGYAPEGKLSMKDMVNIVRKRRSVGNCPPVYPNGWFAVIETKELQRAEAKNVSILGLNLAVFRGEDGRPHVINAYCPHIGANLAVGGRVLGDRIECPFHGWQFRGDDGKCMEIPTLNKQDIPETARVKSYCVLERNGFIYMWHHAEGNEPDWFPPEIEEIKSGKWSYRGRTEHVLNCHIEEVPENGADVAHLMQVHGPIMTTGVDLRYTYNKFWSFARHHWSGNWVQCEEEKHIGELRLTHAIRIFGIHIPVLDMEVLARQIGPGIVYLTFESRMFGRGAYLQAITPVEPLMQRILHHIQFHWFIPTIVAKFFLLGEAMMMGPGIVYLTFNGPLFGRGAFLHNITPVEPLTQRMVHHIVINTWCPTIIAKFLMFSEAVMVERDIMIWNNKKYEGKPLFVKSAEDALIARHRRWYSQFYSKNSPRIKFQKDSLDF